MNKELEEKIDGAKSMEELDAIREEINNKPEEVEEQKEETEVAEDSKEKTIEPEEERKLLKKTKVEERSKQNLEIIERKEETEMEERNSKEYITAFAEYVKGRKDVEELRALITTGGYSTGNSATVEVPDMVYDIVKTAWEREELMSRVKSISVKGNLKVQFEVSGDAAVEHTEGQSAVNEEELILGVVTLTPISIKKWISLSDEVLDMRGEEFLRYIYDEITYRIAKKCADKLVGIIKSLPQSLSANAETGVYDTVSANKVTAAPAVDTIAKAIAALSDSTSEITVVMNKLTYADFKEAQYKNGYGVDVFEGARVVFNNSLPAYSAAAANGVYAIVGDFRVGALANYPNGEEISMKYDDTTLMTQDLVRILGRRYIGVNAVADKAFALVAKPASL